MGDTLAVIEIETNNSMDRFHETERHFIGYSTKRYPTPEDFLRAFNEACEDKKRYHDIKKMRAHLCDRTATKFLESIPGVKIIPTFRLHIEYKERPYSL